MTKKKLDLEMFWNLPRCKGDFIKDGSYCALGSMLKAMGESDSEIRKQFSHPFLYELKLAKVDYDNVWRINDSGYVVEEEFKQLFPEGNPEAAKRLIIQLLMEKDLVEFTEDPLTFKIPAEVKENVKV